MPGYDPYIYGGTADVGSYEELKRRRAVALAMASRQKGYPKNIGEGIASLGEAIGDTIYDQRLQQMEQAQAARDAAREGGVPGRSYKPGGTVSGASGGSAAADPGPAFSDPVLKTPWNSGPPTTAGPAPAPVAADYRDRIAALLSSPQGGAPENPTLPEGQTLGGTPPVVQSDDLQARRRNAIAGIESGGRRDPYQTVGVETRGDRPYGRYGIMGRNVGPWTQEILGQSMTPQQFLADQNAQDTVFDRRMAGYADRYGEEGAARAWLGGPGSVNRPDRRDVLGTSVGDYGANYLARLGGGGDAGGAPAATAQAGRPIRLASLGGAGGTMTDAPMLLPPIPGMQPDEEANADQPTPVEIKPATLPPNRQLAQLPPGVLPGSVLSSPASVAAVPPGTPPPPPAGVSGASGAGARAPNAPPSSTPIPGAWPVPLPQHPGPEPTAPKILGPSPDAEYYLKIANDRRASDQTREWATKMYGVEEGYRKELQAQQNQTYIDKRERWQKQIDEYEKAKREVPNAELKQLSDRVALEKAIHDARIAPIERQLKEAELARQDDVAQKLRNELAIQHVDYNKKVRDLVEPYRVTLNSAVYQQPYDTKTGTFGQLQLAPGSPQPEEKALTQDQAEGVRFVLSTKTDLADLESKYKNGKILTSPTESLKASVPGVGNALVSDEYRAVSNAMNRFESAYMKLASGAAITPSEARLHLPAFKPMAFDDDKELAEKARRRREIVDAAERTSGQQGMAVIAKQIRDAGSTYADDRESKLPPVTVTSPAQAMEMEARGELKPGRRLVDPSGKEIGRVPRR